MKFKAILLPTNFKIKIFKFLFPLPFISVVYAFLSSYYFSAQPINTKVEVPVHTQRAAALVRFD